MSIGDPTKDDGDYENLDELVQIYKSCDKDAVKSVQCQTLDGVNYKYSGDSHVTCDNETGLSCLNSLQESGYCHDYEIRIFCDCEIRGKYMKTVLLSAIWYFCYYQRGTGNPVGRGREGCADHHKASAHAACANVTS
jgi:hypothetical protein